MPSGGGGGRSAPRAGLSGGGTGSGGRLGDMINAARKNATGKR
jgi:hypothetical protein